MSIGLLISAASWAQSKPAITFEDSAVAASGLTPGKSVVWFGVELRVDAEYSTSRTERYHVGTVASDGTARFTLNQPVAVLGFAAGYGIGTVANNTIPGLSDSIQAGLGKILDSIFLSGATKTTLNVTNGLIAAAARELGKITAAGGPEKDPSGKHHPKEIKAMLDRAARLAKRLPGKLGAQTLEKIYALAEQAGVPLQ